MLLTFSILPDKSCPMLDGIVDKTPDSVGTASNDPAIKGMLQGSEERCSLVLPWSNSGAADHHHEGERSEDMDPEVDNDHQGEDVDAV